MERQIRFCISADGTRIAYATVGEGPPLVGGSEPLKATTGGRHTGV